MNRLIIAALLVVGISGLLIPAAIEHPLGFDEAVYAVGARSMIKGGPSTGFSSYRPQGMKLIAAPGILLGGDELALRALPIALTLAFLVTGCAFAWRWDGARAAMILALALLSWRHLSSRGGELLSDVPSALLGLGQLWYLLRATEDRDRAPYRAALGAAICTAAAFWVRYGALIPLAACAITVIVCRPRQSWRRRRALAVFGLATLAGIVPFFVYSQSETGSVTGILEQARVAANNPYLGAGCVYYVHEWFRDVAGPVLGALTVIGLIGGVLDLARRRVTLPVVLVIAGITQTTWLGLSAHGEPRYVFGPVMLLAIAGAMVIARHIDAARPTIRRGALVMLAVISVYSALVALRANIRGSRQLAENGATLLEAAAAIRADTDGLACRVYTYVVPVVTWYTRCQSMLPKRLSARSLPADSRVYLLVLNTTRRASSDVGLLIGIDVVTTPLPEAGTSTFRVTARSAADTIQR